MIPRVLQGTGTNQSWPFPLFLLRTAWADQPFDVLTEWISGLGEAHLLEVVGEPVGIDSDPAAGPVALLPGLLRMLRRQTAHRPPERLSLLTASAGDTSALPAVPGLRDDVVKAGCGVLVRDPVDGTGVCMTARATDGGVLRWRARGIGVCPVAPQPSGPARAAAELADSVEAAATLIEQAAAASFTTATPRGLDIGGTVVSLPRGLGPRTVALIDRADRVEAIVETALRMPGVGAAQMDREPVLRRLTNAVDSARRAAVAAAGEEAMPR